MMTLQDLVQIATNLYPDRRAVCFDECNGKDPVIYTYKTVIDTATVLTDFLRNHCIHTESLEIGLYCYPGINLPSWIIGILRVPATYCPVDPDAPQTLSAYFMNKCNFRYVLVDKDQADKFVLAHGNLFCHNSLEIQEVNLILFQRNKSNENENLLTETGNDKNGSSAVIGTETRLLNQHVETPTSDLLDVRDPYCLAYVLHTSGTTGFPKIVRVPHKCIVPNILHFREIYDITPDDIVFMASALTFDPSVVELFAALSSGAMLLIIPNLIKMMPQELSRVLFNHHRVSVLQATPTLLRRFGAQHIKSTVLSANTSLRILALGGETFPGLDVLRNWKAEGNRTHIFNIYGITEVSCWATCYKVPEEVFDSDPQYDPTVPLGTPLSGTTVEVKDANGSAVVEGEGQVFIGGKERVCFLDDEVTLPMGTMRATGDFVKIKDTKMFFLGRKDNQIKRHGKRLSTEFVQQIAEGCYQVETCAVIWYQGKKLLLFVVPKGIMQKGDLLKQLQERLPSHAVPDELLVIDTLPLTSHGKIDVSKLNEIYSNHLSYRRNDTRLTDKELWEKLQCLWKSLLNLPDDSSSISKDSLFLLSGGDSLKSLQFHDEIEHLVGRTVPGLLDMILSCSIGEVFEHVLKAVFQGRNLASSCNSAVKRKLNENKDEPSKRSIELQSGRSITLETCTGFIAISRGNRILSMEDSLQNRSSIKQAEDNEVSKTTYGKTRVSDANVTEIECMQHSSLEEDLGGAAEKLTLHIRWKSDLIKCVDASPLIVVPMTDRQPAFVCIGSHSHVLQAIDLHSGKVKWERKLADRIESSACVSKCGNFIIVGCYDGLVYILRRNNGEIYWTFATKDAVKSSPAVDPSTGIVFVGSHDQHIYALNIYEKVCVWKLHSEAGAVFSSPYLNLSPHHLYAGTLGGLLLALNPVVGDRVWKYFCRKPIFSSPHCSNDFVCVGCVDGNLYCFTHFGEKVWQFSSSGPIFSSPCISDFTREIFFGSHDCFAYCCTMEGNLSWKFQTKSTVYATPFVFHSKDLEDKTLLAVVSTDGGMWILNTKTGFVEGAGQLPGEVFSSPVVWGTTIVVGCRNNYVYCLDVCMTKS